MMIIKDESHPAGSATGRAVALAIAGGLVSALMVGPGAGPARAVVTCPTSAPALGATVDCTVPGTWQLTVPAGAERVALRVVGAGGGGSLRSMGGAGAVYTGTVDLPPGTAFLNLDVGQAGGGGDSGGGGLGSGAWAADATNAQLATLLVAGGGGGAGFCEASSCTAMGTGGAADAPGASAADATRTATGGQPGLAGVGAAPGPAGVAGTAGSGSGGDQSGTGATGNPGVGDELSLGGVGASVEFYGVGGRGGGGYTGGGGGGGTAAAQDVFGGGGGGGASYRHPTYAGSAVRTLSTSGAGIGGASGSGNAGSTGQDGAIRVTFQEGEIESSPRIDLTLTPKDGTRLHGARARLTGSGLKPQSTYRLSTRGRHLGTGTTSSTGAFTWTLSLPARACVGGGLQELVLSGIAPDDSMVTDSVWVVLGADCRVRESRAARPTGGVVVGDFVFDYRSARLTAVAKRSLDRTASALTGAKVVTVTGYTQTQLTSEASRRANVALARQRAANVKKYLVGRGVTARIVTVSRGPVDPVSTSKQQLNRRVEVSARY